MSDHWENVTCDDPSLQTLPYSDVYLASLRPGYLVALVFIGSFALTLLGLYIEELAFFLQHLHNWKPKDKALYLLGLYPVFGVTSFIALLVPRSSVLDDLVGSLYLSVCVYLFVTMLIGHFGGAHKMVRRLSNNLISLRTPPFCCCCFCLPNLSVTSTRLQTLELLVLQYAVFKPVLSFIATVLWMDGKYINEDLSTTAAYTWINFFNIISTLTAIYAFVIVYKLSHIHLERMCIKPKFICLQMVIILSNFQHVIIGGFVAAGLIHCDPPLSAKANGDRWHHMLLIVELFIIALFARSYYRRHVGELPPDEKIIPDTENTFNEITTTLQRQNDVATGNSYGSIDEGTHGNGFVVQGGQLKDMSSSREGITRVGSEESQSMRNGSLVNADGLVLALPKSQSYTPGQAQMVSVSTSTDDLGIWELGTDNKYIIVHADTEFDTQQDDFENGEVIIDVKTVEIDMTEDSTNA